jgi:hypothetical protein
MEDHMPQGMGCQGLLGRLQRLHRALRVALCSRQAGLGAEGVDQSIADATLLQQLESFFQGTSGALEIVPLQVDVGQ